MSLYTELKRRNVFRVAAAYMVAGWLVTEVLTTVLPTLGAAEWTSRAVVLVFALGLVPAILFELTPDGIRRQQDVDRDRSLVPRRRYRLEIVTLALVVAGVVFLAVFGSRSAIESPGAAGADPSVAVLPFVNLSDNPDNEYFSDGLTETLLHMLAQVPRLKVAARTSSFAFKNENRPVAEIARALGVSHVLEGSVQRAGDRVRITAQLIRADDGFHVWSANYDRTLDDIFAIQDQIASEVGDALTRSLLGEPYVADVDRMAGLNTESPDAYDLYLQALQERATFSFWGLQAEEDLLKGALTIDPDFIAAKNALAYNYLRQVETGLMTEAQAFEQVIALAEQVLDVRPQDADARAILLFVDVASQSAAITAERVNESLSGLGALVAEHPDETGVRLLLVRLLGNLHRYEEARALLAEALEGDPLNANLLFELGAVHADLGQWDEAEALLQRSLAIEPKQPNAYATLAGIRLNAGDAVGYVEQILRAIDVDPTDYELSAVVAAFLYRLGLVEEADDFRNRVRSIAPTSAVAYRIDMLRALAIGDPVTAEETARRAIGNDIANRQNAFVDAVRVLLQLASAADDAAAALGWIEERIPGIFDLDDDSLPRKYRAAQFVAFSGWYEVLPDAELDGRLERFLEHADSFGLRLDENPTMHVQVLALRGDVREAVRVMLDTVMAGTALKHLGLRDTLEQPLYSEIVADARVQAQIERWAGEEAAAAERVRGFFADLRENRTAASRDPGKALLASPG